MLGICSRKSIIALTEFKIENGKVFINGVETTNPELIGLAILDLAEELLEKEDISNEKDN